MPTRRRFFLLALLPFAAASLAGPSAARAQAMIEYRPIVPNAKGKFPSVALRRKGPSSAPAPAPAPARKRARGKKPPAAQTAAPAPPPADTVEVIRGDRVERRRFPKQ